MMNIQTYSTFAASNTPYFLIQAQARITHNCFTIHENAKYFIVLTSTKCLSLSSATMISIYQLNTVIQSFFLRRARASLYGFVDAVSFYCLRCGMAINCTDFFTQVV
eukprot:575368_1